MKRKTQAAVLSAFLLAGIFAQSEDFSTQEFASALMATISEKGFDAALENFSALEKPVFESEQIQYIRTSILLSAGRAKEALAAASSLAEKFPENADYTYLVLLSAKSAGDEEKKSEAISKMTKIDPYDERANTELGDEQMLKKNWQRASRFYQKALTKNESYAPALFGLGKSSYYLKKDDEARKALEKAIAADPSFDMAYSYLAKLDVEKSRYADAAEKIRLAIRISPDYCNHWLDLGEYCRELGRADESIAAFSRAIELNGGYFLCYVLRGGMYDAKGDDERALQDYLKAIRLNPQYFAVYDLAGQIARRKSDWQMCEKIYFPLLENYPSNIMFAAQALSSLCELGKHAEAREAALRTMKGFDKTSCEYLIARLFYDNAASDSVFSKAAAEPQKDKRAVFLYCMAIYFEARKDEAKASAAWQKLCEIAPLNLSILRICKKKFDGQQLF